MDAVTAELVRNKYRTPLDLVRYINEFVYQRLTNHMLWVVNEEACQMCYGHISRWNTSWVTNMSNFFHGAYLFNQAISRWDVSNVRCMSHGCFGGSSLNQDTPPVVILSDISHLLRDLNC